MPAAAAKDEKLGVFPPLRMICSSRTPPRIRALWFLAFFCCIALVAMAIVEAVGEQCWKIGGGVELMKQ